MAKDIDLQGITFVIGRYKDRSAHVFRKAHLERLGSEWFGHCLCGRKGLVRQFAQNANAVLDQVHPPCLSLLRRLQARGVAPRRSRLSKVSPRLKPGEMLSPGGIILRKR